MSRIPILALSLKSLTVGLAIGLGTVLSATAIAQTNTQQVSAADAEEAEQTADTPDAPAPLAVA